MTFTARTHYTLSARLPSLEAQENIVRVHTRASSFANSRSTNFCHTAVAVCCFRELAQGLSCSNVVCSARQKAPLPHHHLLQHRPLFSKALIPSACALQRVARAPGISRSPLPSGERRRRGEALAALLVTVCRRVLPVSSALYPSILCSALRWYTVCRITYFVSCVNHVRCTMYHVLCCACYVPCAMHDVLCATYCLPRTMYHV